VETRLVRNVGFWQCDGSLCLRAARDTRLPPNIVALLPDPRLAAGFISITEYSVGSERVGAVWRTDWEPEPAAVDLARREIGVIAVVRESDDGHVVIDCRPDTKAAFLAAAMATAVEQRTHEWDFSPQLEIRSAAHEARLSLSWSAEGWTVATAETEAR
jgi:hypothetical protein